MDIFDRKGIKPMLLTEDHTPTDSSDYICELKLDGIRCLTYLSNHTDLRNKRDIPLIAAFPELSSIHTKARGKCILDGELIIPSSDGSPDFETMQARSMLTDPVRIRLASKINPAAFVAFDILYRDGNELMHLPLMERKRLLSDVVSESSRLTLSRMFDNSSALFELTVRQGLEGIVQKRKNSLYHPGKRSRDWIKLKNLIDEDFVACGYMQKGRSLHTYPRSIRRRNAHLLRACHPWRIAAAGRTLSNNRSMFSFPCSVRLRPRPVVLVPAGMHGPLYGAHQPRQYAPATTEMLPQR